MLKYKKEIREMEDEVPQLKTLLDKPYEKEAELRQMKAELAGLEREITQSIKAKQEAQLKENGDQLNLETTETPISPDEEITVNSELKKVEQNIDGPEAKVVSLANMDGATKTKLLKTMIYKMPPAEPEVSGFKKTKGLRL